MMISNGLKLKLSKGCKGQKPLKQQELWWVPCYQRFYKQEMLFSAHDKSCFDQGVLSPCYAVG